MTSTGAGIPVQRSNAAAPWAHEHLEPVDDARARRDAAAASAVGAVAG